jgi:starch synthase
MKIGVAAAEMAPFAKAGGLADVVGALPREFAARGNQVSVILPGYAAALRSLPTEPMGDTLSVWLGSGEERFSLRSGIGPDGLPIYFVMHDRFFGRAGLYGEHGRDYPDNFARFVFFSRAAARVLAMAPPDVVHAHDWHSALLLVAMRADPELRDTFARTAAIFTIHNLAFQGLFDASQFSLLNLASSYFSVEGLEFYGQGNLMKGAIAMADMVTTVSPTYAREVTADHEFGFGLEGVLRAKEPRFIGILNGADYAAWNPATDRHIARNYSPGDPAGKATCALDLRARLSLSSGSGRPLVGMVSRLSPQKGFDLLGAALERLLARDLQLVILGSGDVDIEQRLEQAQTRYPERLRTIRDFDEPLAHRIQAGCDMFLMPSRFEPCGLTQMYALKYGTVPIVRATGGLADTVHEFVPASGSGNGLRFSDYTADALLAAVDRALALFRDPAQWRRLVANCFASEFPWSACAERYLALFGQALAERR